MDRCPTCEGFGVKDDDICPDCMGSGTVPDRSKIVRRSDPPESHESAMSVDLKGDRLLVFNAMRANEANHPEGYTRAEIAEYVYLGYLDTMERRQQRARIESLRRRVSDFVTVVERTGEKRGREALLKLKHRS